VCVVTWSDLYCDVGCILGVIWPCTIPNGPRLDAESRTGDCLIFADSCDNLCGNEECVCSNLECVCVVICCDFCSNLVCVCSNACIILKRVRSNLE